MLQLTQLPRNKNDEAILSLQPELCEMNTAAWHRFMTKVSVPADANTCWTWSGQTDKDGYGTFWVSAGELIRVHRASFERHVGPIPEGALVVQSCGNKLCINPKHMLLTTYAEMPSVPLNTLDDLTGRTICSLHVDALDHRDRFGNIYWACTCLLCGGKKVARANVLRAGKFLTCSSTKCRFYRQVSKTDCCWEWTGTLKETGYGRFGLDGKALPAHRVAWELAYGAIPEGRWVLHHCDNPKCVRPDHLFLGTHKDNVEDMVAKDRQRKGAKPKLTDEEVAQMRLDYSTGEHSQAGLATKYGITVRTVGRILRGKSRKDKIP